MKTPARAISYFLSVAAIAGIFFSIEFVTEKFFYPNDEVVDILAAVIGALLFTRCKKFFDRVTDRIFRRADRDVRAEFIMNISHELQTPIAILRGNVELLQRRGISDAERSSAERVILTTLDGMSRLIGGVLESAKLKFSSGLLYEEEIEIGPLLREAREDCLLLAEDRGIAIAADGGTGMAIRGDRGKLKEVLLNLISNALKHTPGGGRIALCAELAGGSAGDVARVVVEDTGCGIAPDELPHIFERFYRITASSAAVPGTGLGLNICREIVNAHGGTITAESEPGKGSRFIVSLPLSSPSPPAGPRAAPPAPSSASAIINS